MRWHSNTHRNAPQIERLAASESTALVAENPEAAGDIIMYEASGSWSGAFCFHPIAGAKMFNCTALHNAAEHAPLHKCCFGVKFRPLQSLVA